MRNLLAVIGLLVVGFVGLGWYMGWYKLSVTRGSDGNLQITTNVNTNKVGSDSTEFFKNAATIIGNHAEKAAQEAKTSAPTGAAGGTPGPVAPPQGAPVAPDTQPALFGPPAPTPQPAPTGPPAPKPPFRGPIQLLPPK